MVVIAILIVMHVIDSRLRIPFNLKELNFFLSKQLESTNLSVSMFVNK